MVFNKRKYLLSIEDKVNFRHKNAVENNSKRIVKNAKRSDYKPKAKFQAPNWFINKKNVDVSIIIPLYKSSDEVKEQIKHWHFDDKYTTEIIYVNDFCPESSYEVVLNQWEAKKGKSIGNIIYNLKNLGYGESCNEGAKIAKGKYLIFLNADCIVSKNWISPIIDLLQQDKVGIVGNLQLKANEDIDSAGSEWNWETRNFQHIGRSVFNKKFLNKPYKLNNCPEVLLETQEREMVTGCCFGIKNNLFYDLEGFDKNYKIGYWEDADLCLRVKTDGYKIMYEPKSVIYHAGGHTGSVNHRYKSKNKEFFEKRWISTQRIDSLIKHKRTSLKKITKPKMIGCIIACNEEEFLEAAVDSISPVIDKWIIVIGGNEYAYQSGMCDSKGYPKDKTLEISKKLVKKYGGLVIEPPNRLWKDKVEMRNEYAKLLKQNEWMFMLDGDEVYKPNQLYRIQELMREGYECFILNFWTFWNNVNTIGTGVWDNYPQERIVKWQKGYHYSGKNHLFVSDVNNNLVRNKVKTFSGKERLFYHYSWVRPLQKIKQKRDYYKFQSGHSGDHYLESIFLEWRKNPSKIEGNTHPFGGGGTEEFKGIHPIQVQKLIDQNKLNF